MVGALVAWPLMRVRFVLLCSGADGDDDGADGDGGGILKVLLLKMLIFENAHFGKLLEKSCFLEVFILKKKC